MKEGEPPIESKEKESSVVKIIDIQEFYGMSLENIGRQTVSHLLRKIEAKIEKEDVLRKKFKLSADVPIATALQQKAEEAIREYQSLLQETRERFTEQSVACETVAKEKGYPTENSEYSVVITQEFFNMYLVDLHRSTAPNSYDTRSNTVIIFIDESNRQFAHEIGHAMSTSKDKTRTGFIAIEEAGTEYKNTENLWFNEGATLLWEDASVNDGSRIESYNEKYARYPFYKEVVKLILAEIGMSEDELLKAYFGDREKNAELRRKIQERFNCSLEDLDCLMLWLDLDFIKQIIHGQPIEISIKKKRPENVIRDTEKVYAEKLSRIFPNVTVRMD